MTRMEVIEFSADASRLTMQITAVRISSNQGGDSLNKEKLHDLPKTCRRGRLKVPLKFDFLRLLLQS
ncbi:hypothetical protein CPT06_04370 [Bacillus vallismortis]|nr:hypothetical protein CPT06_04370 [Bacillus vallismortis]QAV10227.1 hypothetical protein BV11031_17400 [Bacillus vallismortis]